MRRTPILLLSLALALALAACGATVPAPSAPDQPPASDGPTTPPVAEEAVATLAIDPATTSLTVGETAELTVLLDLKQFLSTSSTIEITFDPAVLEVVDADGAADGTQVGVGMFETAGLNEVQDGRIRLLLYSLDPAKAASGSGTVATITVKGLAAGSTELKIDRVDGDSTTKTKVALKDTATDILSTATGATVTVTQ